MGSESKNVIWAIAVSMAILLGYNYFFPSTPTPQPQKTQTESLSIAQATPPLSLDQALTTSQRVSVTTPSLKGSISLTGARFDDATLTRYHTTTESDSPPVQLLSPQGTKDPYFADFGWRSPTPSLKLPTPATVWTLTQGSTLTPETPITLTWDNGEGLVFQRVFEIDPSYMITIRDTVTNKSISPVTLHHYGLISRGGKPPVSDFFILYEGPIGYLAGKLKEHAYKNLLEDKKISYETTSGWLGMTDKYWLTALIPDQSVPLRTSFTGSDAAGGGSHYQTDFLTQPHALGSGQTYETTTHLFVGAKDLNLLDGYEDTLKVPHLDLAVDFGWFYFITKPIFYALTFLNEMVGNFGVAILLLTILARLLFLPLANKSYTSMARMRKFQPEMKRVQTLYKDDKVKQQQELLALYKKHKINPASGCLPLLIQAPIFFALYKVLFISLAMRHAPFFGWIHDLSAADPTNLFTLFGLIPWTAPSFLHVGLLPLLMGITMFLQQKLNPSVMDASQQKIFLIMPILFTYMLSSMPAGAVLYWTWSNVLGIFQQIYIMRKAQVSTPLKKK